VALVLHFLGNIVFEVISVEDGGATLVVGALWADPKLSGVQDRVSKADMRSIGYAPMEIEDAVIAKLRP
jgi:hypothetical protein